MKGKLVCFEGLDKVGKSTQISILSEILAIEEIKHKVIKFPYNDGTIYSIIENYNTELVDLDPHAAHLLYSANRWQMQSTIKEYLDADYIVIVDRYLFSGISYSVGSNNIDLKWAANSECGLILPDIVFYLYVDQDEQIKRLDQNKSRFETIEIQRQVEKVYNILDNGWKKIDANGSKSETSLIIQHYIKELLEL